VAGIGGPTTDETISHLREAGSYPEGAGWTGALDQAGNVSEWCSDWCTGSYATGAPTSDPKGPASGDCWAVRGGSWSSLARNCRAASRYHDQLVRYECMRPDIGFRLVRAVGP
jgi:formylglycine-generating enzyme required for sulfatase activity